MPVNQNKKVAGVLIPVFAMRHNNDLGIGDTQAMQESIDFCAEHGIGILQVLPINETGGDNSPYNAISSIAIDPMLLSMSPHTVPGLTQEILDRLAPKTLVAQLQHGPIQYPRVRQLKEDLLTSAFREFEQNHINKQTSIAHEFADFQKNHCSWLPYYTLFRTLMQENKLNACWTDWEPELRSYASADNWLKTHDELNRLSQYRQFCAYVQWVAFSQWTQLKAYAERLGIELMGDIPFGVSRYSADVWAQRHLFDLTWSGGAPPETFFQTDPFVQKWGQNWGIPLYNWTAHSEDHFSWWRERVKRIGDCFHYFRIDHVLGFFRIYAFPWFPEFNDQFVHLNHEQVLKLTGGRLPQFLPRPDEPESLGLQNASQGKALLKVILDAAGSVGVVAEDLGVVPNYVRPILRELGIPGFYVPIFERNESDLSLKPQNLIPELSLATYATHDHMPIAAYYHALVNKWHGPDGHQGWLEIQRLMRFLNLDEQQSPVTFTSQLHLAFLEVLLQSRSWLTMFMITDILGSSQRFNEPGSASDANWSQRLDRPLSSYVLDPKFAQLIKSFTVLVEKSGRRHEHNVSLQISAST
ncbi:MAG: 4-alpha-glucanotransferase [Candidatus Melainabacteria bacterium]|nr:4-alpha-glucanotransferase [Candidatus Melainabacteria bacterium]